MEVFTLGVLLASDDELARALIRHQLFRLERCGMWKVIQHG